MESVFLMVLIFLAFFFYLTNRENLINRWCAFYMAISSVGVLKEAFLYQFVPWAQVVWGDVIRQDVCIGIYSVLTWVSYSFAAPVAIIMGLYIYGLNHANPKRFAMIKATICVPALVLSLIYKPLSFRTHQLEDPLFWVIYSIYNLGFGIVLIALMFRGIHIEKSKTIKRNKLMISAIILPPTIYALITIFVVHPLGLEQLFKAWLWNMIILILSAAIILIMTFKNGFLGFKLSVQNYDWDSDMDLLGRSADYTSHMLKNQTSKMEMCIEQLNGHFSNTSEELPEELAILSRSLSTIKNYVDRMKRHSQSVRLFVEPCGLRQLLTDAMPTSLAGQSDIQVRMDVAENVFWVCDRSHMTEVFSNIIANAVEAMRSAGAIEIVGTRAKADYLLRITDDGVGMNEEEMHNMFAPYFTTKSTEKNFGLGLAYCKNIITKHGGSICAKSKPGKGTTVAIAMPLSRVSTSGDGRVGEDV